MDYLYKWLLETIFLGILLLTVRCVTPQSAPQRDSFKCTLLEDSSWDCICTEANKVFVLHQSPYFIVCNSNLKIQIMKNAGSQHVQKKTVSHTTAAPENVNKLQNSDESLFRKLFMGLHGNEKPKETIVQEKKEPDQTSRIAALLKHLETYQKAEADINRNSAPSRNQDKNHYGVTKDLTKSVLLDKLDQLQKDKVPATPNDKQTQGKTKQGKTADKKLWEQFEAFKKAMKEKSTTSANQEYNNKNLQAAKNQNPASISSANNISQKNTPNDSHIHANMTTNDLLTKFTGDKNNSLIEQHNSTLFNKHVTTTAKTTTVKTTTVKTTSTTHFPGCEFNGKKFGVGKSIDFFGCVLTCVAEDNMVKKCKTSYG